MESFHRQKLDKTRKLSVKTNKQNPIVLAVVTFPYGKPGVLSGRLSQLPLAGGKDPHDVLPHWY